MACKINYIFTIFLIILSIIHIAFTPMIYNGFNLSSLWFAGSGLSFLFLGIINILRAETTKMFFKLLCFICNILALVFCALLVLKLSQPQTFICLSVIVIILGLSLFDLRPDRKLK